MVVRKISEVLNKQEKRKFIFLFVLVIAQVLLDVLGVASILPFMKVISDSDSVFQNRWLSYIYTTFDFSSLRGMLIAMGLLVLGLTVMTNLVGLLTTWLKMKYSWDIAHKFAMRLLRTKLEYPLQYFLQTNSSDIKTYVISETNSIASGIIIPLIEFISKGAVAVILLGLLVVVDWKVSLIMFTVLGGAYVMIFLQKRKYLEEIGEKRLDSNTMRYRTIDELLNGIKTIMVYNSQPLFYHKFGAANKEFTDIQPRYQFLTAAPAYFLQILAFGTIISLTIFFYVTMGDISNYIPTLTLYALAGYRLLPSLQGAFAAISALKHSMPIMDRLHEELSAARNIDFDNYTQPQERLPFQKEVSLSDITFRYQDSDYNVVDGVSLTIKKGERVAFVGSTGSGKTTAIDIMVGLHKALSGHILVDGTKVVPENVKQWQNNIAYVPQDVFLFDDTVAQNISLGQTRGEINMERLVEAAKVADIHNFIVESLGSGYDTVIGERGVRLSGGQRQRLGLARAIYMQPSLLVLDEATSSVDMITEQNIINALNTLPRDMTLIVIAHRLATVKDMDRIYFMENGNIASTGTYESLQKDNTVFQDLVNLS